MPFVPTPQSSNVAGYDYDPSTQELRVTFTSGHSGVYQNVPQSEVDGLASASSVGRYLYENIRDMYPYRRG